MKRTLIFLVTILAAILVAAFLIERSGKEFTLSSLMGLNETVEVYDPAEHDKAYLQIDPSELPGDIGNQEALTRKTQEVQEAYDNRVAEGRQQAQENQESAVSEINEKKKAFSDQMMQIDGTAGDHFLEIEPEGTVDLEAIVDSYSPPELSAYRDQDKGQTGTSGSKGENKKK